MSHRDLWNVENQYDVKCVEDEPERINMVLNDSSSLPGNISPSELFSIFGK